jgi:hypothetical protein
MYTKTKNFQFLAPSHSRKKRLVASGLLVYPHVSTRIPLEGFLWNLLFGILCKSVERTQMSEKMPGTLLEGLSGFRVFGSDICGATVAK